MAKAKPVVSATDKRKPPSPQSEIARAKFVAGHAAGTVKRQREKLTVYVESDVLTTLRVFCARERRELSDVTTEALRKLFTMKEA